MSPPTPDPYKTLGVDRNADISVIKTAYRKLVLKCHPDKVQDPALKAAKQDEFQRVQQAYEVLGDEKKRREYDEESSLRKLRDELSRGAGRAASHRPASSPYKEANTHNADPRASYKPGPSPTSPFMPYPSGSPRFSHTAEFPIRTKVFTRPSHHSAQREAGPDKTREDVKEDRRRRKDDADYYDMSRERERERDRERDREAERERQRERDRKPRADRERDDKKDRSRRDNDKRDKERDRARRQDMQDKFRSKKAVYVEDYSELDGAPHMPKKKASGGIGTPVGANTSSKRHTDSPRRDRSAPRAESPRPDIETRMRAAYDYIKAQSGGAVSESVPQVRVADVYWEDRAPRGRGSSQDDKKMRGRANVDGLAGDGHRAFIPPRLSKSYTSPPGALHMSDSAPRVPGLTRATTDMFPLPEAPTVPIADPVRSSRKSERRRQTYDAGYDDEGISYRQVYAASPSSRSSKPSQHRTEYFTPVGSASASKPFSDRVKESPRFSRDQVYQSKPYSEEDVHYSPVPRSYVQA